MDVDWNAEVRWSGHGCRELPLRIDGLGGPQGSTQPAPLADAPMVRLVLSTSVEGIHHGAEICLLRDLYLRREV
jgi:hypothetical protein